MVGSATNSPARPDVYCDVTTPPEWAHTGEVSTVDLDLDVCRTRGDGSVHVADEDGFAGHQGRHGYPPHVISRAERTAEWLSAALRDGTEPFGMRYRTWLAQVSRAQPCCSGRLGERGGRST